MKILSYFVFGLSISFLILGILYLKNNPKNKRNYLFFFTILGSFLWGLGYSLLIIQSSVAYAVFFRALGLLGSIFFAMFGVNLFADIASVSDKFKKVILISSILGIILFPFLTMPDRLVYIATSQGMNYEVVPDLWNNLYSVYGFCLLVLFLIILIKMRKSSIYKREKVMNNGLWLFFGAYLSGIVIDLVISSFGFGACPGSTISQFIAVFIIYKYLIYQKVNTLSFDNVFNHIHHSIEMPIIVFGSDRKLKFASDAFYNFFEKEQNSCIGMRINELFVLDSEDDVYRIVGGNLVKECFTLDTNRYCSLTIEKVIDSYDDIVGYIVLVNDLTEKYRFISELKEAKENAETAFKTRDEKLSIVSIDMRSLLNDIIKTNQLMSNSERVDNIKNLSVIVDGSAKKIIEILNDIK